MTRVPGPGNRLRDRDRDRAGEPVPAAGRSSDTAAGPDGPRRRPGRPPRSEGAETRRHILEVATRCFRQTGYDGTSLQAIAEEAGLTRTALYNYFDSRAALVRAVLFESAVDAARTGIDQHWWERSTEEGRSGRERVRLLLRASVEDARRTLGMGNFYLDLVRESAGDPQLRAVLRDYVQGVRSAIRSILEESVNRSELPPDTDLDQLLEAVLGMAWALSSAIATAPTERVREQVLLALDLVLDTAPWRRDPEQGTR
jgi:AcrR family transcriptional regulator